MEKKTDPYQPLFDHMHQEHGLTLLESEMADIIHVVEKMQQRKPQSAVWVKAYNGMTDGIYNMKVASNISHVVMLGVGSVLGGEIVLITFLNKTTFGKEDVQKEDVTVYYLDENPAPSKESDAADVIAFHNWMIERGWAFHRDEKMWYRSDNYHQWPPDEVIERAEQLYELFIKQKEAKP